MVMIYKLLRLAAVNDALARGLTNGGLRRDQARTLSAGG